MYIRRDERAGVIAESRRNVHLVAPLTELSTAHGRSLSYHEYSTANLGSSFHFRYDAVMKSTLVNLDDISEAAVTCPGTNEIAVFLADVRVAEPWLARLRADDDDLIFSGGQFVEHTCLDTNGHFSPFLRRALRLKAASVQLPGGDIQRFAAVDDDDEGLRLDVSQFDSDILGTPPAQAVLTFDTVAADARDCFEQLLWCTVMQARVAAVHVRTGETARPWWSHTFLMHQAEVSTTRPQTHKRRLSLRIFRGLEPLVFSLQLRVCGTARKLSPQLPLSPWRIRCPTS